MGLPAFACAYNNAIRRLSFRRCCVAPLHLRTTLFRAKGRHMTAEGPGMRVDSILSAEGATIKHHVTSTENTEELLSVRPPRFLPCPGVFSHS